MQDNKNNGFKIVNGILENYWGKGEAVTIPDSVTFIGDKAFQRCKHLKSVTIPNSVIYIGDKAFDSCYSLKSVITPDSGTTIGEWAFVDCFSLDGDTRSKLEQLGYSQI